MNRWRSGIELSRLFWEDYRDSLLSLDGESFPGVRKLNSLLPAGLSSRGECPIRFVPAHQLPAVDYEKHIFITGEVSTREKNWHDLFNALVWSRFPSLKVAMNGSMSRIRSSSHSMGRNVAKVFMPKPAFSKISIQSTRDLIRIFDTPECRCRWHKKSFPQMREANTQKHLYSHLPSINSLADLAPCLWHFCLFDRLPGFCGPIPPPLLIRVFSIQLCMY